MPPLPPASLSGLKSFSLTQETETAGAPLPVYISPGKRLADGSLEWVLHGQPGSRYIIERSTNLAEWERLTIVTPADGIANFSERAWSGRIFYRARRLE